MKGELFIFLGKSVKTPYTPYTFLHYTILYHVFGITSRHLCLVQERWQLERSLSFVESAVRSVAGKSLESPRDWYVTPSFRRFMYLSPWPFNYDIKYRMGDELGKDDE